MVLIFGTRSAEPDQNLLAYGEIVVILYLFKKSKGRMSAMEISRKPNLFMGPEKEACK